MSADAAVLIRRARESDADALGGMHVRVWRWAYRDLMPADFLAGLSAERKARQWQANLAADWLTTWVAESHGDIVGHAGAAATRDTDLPAGTGELVMINVLAEYTGRGVGRGLMEAAEAHWRSLGTQLAVLWVLSGNEHARAFYERLGWQADGTVADYVVDGATIEQMRMRKRLP